MRVVFCAPSARPPRPPHTPTPPPPPRGCPPPVVDNLATIFHRTFAQWWGPRTDDVLRASLLTLCRQPGVATLTDLPRLLTEPAFRTRVTRATTDPVLRGFWSSYEELTDSARNQVIGPLLNKLRHFLFRQFVRDALAAGPSTVDLGDVLDHGGICLARIPKGSLGEDTSRLMGSLLVARTWQATTARVGTHPDQRPDATLALDEAHNFLNLATPLEDMLAEARGLRLSLVIAHQNLGQLPTDMRAAVSANARNKVIFTASPEDARDLARHTTPWLSEHDLTHLDAFHAAARVLVRGQQAPPFTLTTQPLPPAVPGRAREIRAAARARLAAPLPTTESAEPDTDEPATPDLTKSAAPPVGGGDPRLS
ncbi:type IV secretory system conjugative DNA transfer family protein, partial [Nocardia cyriacigeorgica]|uniref:type IV secretory system conjugative DNA transfer family protein n=1 Tax=Nocardia cyriacigeorgica TaxID=135487 RepID=UPI002455CABF